MLGRILTAGLIGGLLGGAIIAVFQTVTTIPLILEAETCETAEHFSLLHLVHAVDHVHAAGGVGDLERFGLTLVATIAVATGCAWMLLAAMFARGEAIDARGVVPWALAAFFAAGLAPSLGLPPALSGTATADLVARQLWWLFAAVASAGGLAAIFFGRTKRWTLLGLAAIVLPHLIGAPRPDEANGGVPAGIAAQFVSASLFVQLLMWIVPGAIAGYVVSQWKAPWRFRDLRN